MQEKNPNFFDSKVQQERVLNHKSGTQVLLQSYLWEKKHLMTMLLSFPHLVKKTLTYPTYFQNCCDDKMKQHM